MSSNNLNLADDLAAILDELKDEDLAALPEDEVLNMRKKINPYGRTIEGSDKQLNFSITQIKHEYYKKLIISGFVAFLNRMNDEWKVPEGVPVVPVYEYLDDPSKVDTPQGVLDKGYQKTIDEYQFNRDWMKKRVVVKEFLEEMFQFNPEEHVRSSYRPCRMDATRKPIETMAGKLAVEHLKQTDPEFRAAESLYEDTKTNSAPANTTPDETKEAKYTTKKVKKTVVDKKTGKKKVVLVNQKVLVEHEPVDTSKKLGKDLKDPNCAKQVREFLPPHDMFGRFKMYYESNYEDLRDFVRDAYCEKPDFELAINPYSVHDTEDEAETFKKKHRNEVIAEVFTATFGKWNFFDSFKEQRENVNFYNDNTIILEEMMKQLKKDEMLGQDLMKKRVSKMKKKNVAEVGPDAESFRRYVKQNKDIQSLGAEYLGDKADDDIPDDAVQVDVWRVAKGGLEVTKDKFYSAAEAPTFVQEAQEKAKAGQGMTGTGNDLTAPAPDLPARADNVTE